MADFTKIRPVEDTLEHMGSYNEINRRFCE